eukprot:12902880-Prorocentrum_lima.AAC.1
MDHPRSIDSSPCMAPASDADSAPSSPKQEDGIRLGWTGTLPVDESHIPPDPVRVLRRVAHRL